MIGIVTDGILCALLFITLIFAWRLNQRLTDMREGQGDLQTLVKALNDAVEKANTSIVNLRLAAREAEEMLARKLDGARAMTDELGIMTETGDRIAGRLSTGLAKPMRASQNKSSSSVFEADATDQASLQQMLKAVKGMR